MGKQRPTSIEKINELDARPTHLQRTDYAIARDFRRFMTQWAGTDEYRWRAISSISLKEVCGWTNEMIGMVFGIPRGQVARMLASVKGVLAKEYIERGNFLAQFYDGDSDGYIAVKASDVTKIQELLQLIPETRREEAQFLIDILEEQLCRWRDNE